MTNNLDNQQENMQNGKLSDGSNLIVKQIENVMRDSMMPYAEYVILDRALPRVEDGLKPVQRRILYTMYELGMAADKPYRKSARIVGDCLGKYHPHGDTSVYDAMVRMAQPFNMRMPLVDGQGNYGSIDGDGAAAMRYTEARLQPLALELLRDIDKDTVPFSLNFDDTLKEPDVLPGRYPNLLVNGASGIAVGLATNIPPHNLGEVIEGVIYCIDHRSAKLHDIMKYIKGPDFPTGGYIIAHELEQAYTTGKGKIYIRARVEIEQINSERKQIVITELPYQVNKANLLMSILKLQEDKKDELSGIAEIVDESDKEGIRAVVKLKKDSDVNKILKLLYRHTDMQITFGMNMVAIANGRPMLMGLKDIIEYYIKYQQEVIVRRTKYQLDEAAARQHIVKGLVIAVSNIDEVVAILKKAASTTDAKSQLRKRFELSEKQAQAILDLRLARITKLEVTKLEEELEQLNKLVEQYTAILGSIKIQYGLIKLEMTQIMKTYKSPRRSIIVENEKKLDKLQQEDFYPPKESVVVALSSIGELRYMPSAVFSANAKYVPTKTIANITSQVVEVGDNNMVLGFSNFGNCYKIDFTNIEQRKLNEEGIKLASLFDDVVEGEKLIKIMPLGNKVPKGDLLFYTAEGMIKRTTWLEYDVNRQYFTAVKLKEGDSVINVETLVKDNTILFVTEDGMSVNFSSEEVPTQGRVSTGVKAINKKDDCKVVFGGQITDEGEVFMLTDKGFVKKIISCDIDITARYRKGITIMSFGSTTGSKIVFADYVTRPYNIALQDENATYQLNTEDMPILSKASKGKIFNDQAKKTTLIAVVHMATAQDKVVVK